MASPMTREFTLDFLQHITNNFSEDRIIGKGGFAVVYKGVLDNGEEIALKKLTHKRLDDKEFTNEFNNIIRAHHQNIVQFVGYCYHPGTSWIMHHGQYIFVHEPIRILCFEYLHGGNLERQLSDEQPCTPDWQICYKIIKGVCQGLNYLHNGHIDSIYHLDLKPANILLGKNMIPKIGDFGISRIFSSTKTITTATRMMGTMGFMPPEYIEKQEISSKYDVFSLGAIIIQIMAGRQSYHDCLGVPSEKIIELVCEKWQKLHPTMSSHTWQEVKTCIRIALRCLENDRHKRPTIREIVDELNIIDIETLSLTNEATNLQSRVASVYNNYMSDGIGSSTFVQGESSEQGGRRGFGLNVDASGSGLCVNNNSSGGGYRGEGYNPSFENANEYPPSQQPAQPNPPRTIDLNSIRVHGSSRRFEPPVQPIDYEHEPIMRNRECRSIGRPRDVTQTDDGHCSREGSIGTHVAIDIMDISGVTTGMNEYANLFQWAKSAISSKWRGNQEQELQNKLFHLQSGLQHLSDTFSEIYNFINRAEWRSHKDDVAELLRKLKDTFYDVEDLLDELRWYNHKVIVEGNASQISITDFFNSFISVNDIQKRLDLISNHLGKKGLGEVTPRFDKTARPETSSFPNETKIFGRDMVIEQILGVLDVPPHSSTHSKRKRETSVDEPRLPDLPVLPIVGIGGVGKTTLAQHICNHPKVKSHFNPIIWICVSDDFDVKRLTKEAIESNPGKEATTENLNSLQKDLSKILHKKRFLIVLDDMWDDALKENGQRWKRFCAPLQDVLQGSMMLVTTRSPKVAGLVAKTMEPIILEGLTEKDGVFWNFFKLCVFGSESSDDFPELEQIGREILPKLKGSPLAAKTLGRMLQDDLRTSHWNNILDSELWELDQEATEIVPALRLSYMYLPFHLKRCFSFCAVYPKDTKFEKDYLAEIWVAEGFVKRRGDISVQDIGCQYFNDLVNRAFFQKVQGKYSIHDLLHDMAQKVSEDDCFIVKKKDDFRRIPTNVRHLSVLSSKDINNSDLSSLHQCKKLRTLLCDKPLANKKTPAGLLEGWCSELLCMRVIVFASLNELPASIGKLKHLRYLKISWASSLTSLPGTICMLHNLQVLCVKKCKLESLPSDFSMLVNIWRFESQGFKYGPNIRRFQQELYYGVNLDAADDKQGLGFRLIKNMKQLRGHLVVSNIHELSKNHSAEAELWNKGYLDKLTLEWSSRSSQSGDNEIGIEVLRHLQPPAGVKSLVLEGYPGVSLPSWFQPQSLPGLTSVSFLYCGDMGFSSLTDLIIDRCHCLSSLEQLLDATYLPVINKIAIMNCHNLISVPTERFGEFRCLEIFKVVECEKINSQSLSAPSLKKLVLEESWGNITDSIQCCSLTHFFLSSSWRLTSIQIQMWNLPALKELHIKYCRNLRSIGQSGHVFTKLTSLTIIGCYKLPTIDGLLHEEYLPAIESITIDNCNKLSTMHGERFGGFSSLKDLKVSNCCGLKWGGLLPSSLRSLHLSFCGDISSIIPSCLGNLQSLVSLKIVEGRGIISIPGHLWSSTLSSLQELQIRACWDLKSIGGADDISEIQNVLIDQCTKLKVKGMKQPVKRGSFLISTKREQRVKRSSNFIWCP